MDELLFLCLIYNVEYILWSYKHLLSLYVVVPRFLMCSRRGITVHFVAMLRTFQTWQDSVLSRLLSAVFHVGVEGVFQPTHSRLHNRELEGGELELGQKI